MSIVLDWLSLILKGGGAISLTSFLILAVMVVIFAITLILSNNDRVHTVMFLSIIGFYILTQLCCAPNPFDMYKMTPMAEKISTYIEQNGIPKSLKDIPDLPYELKECKKEITYGDENDIPRTYKTEKSRWVDIEERCHFKNITLHFGLGKSLKFKKDKWVGTLSMNSSHNTVLGMDTNEHNNSKFYFDEMGFQGKTSGICNSLKQ